jgi:glycosyltransferase involved in cell wall biosynthesis
MPESIKRLASTRVITLGYVPDINTIYDKVRLVAAPLRYGAGVKGKVLESLAAGVPCVMTPVAAEGIALPEIFTGAIAEEPVQIAARILRLYTHEHESQRVAQAGLACIAAGYDEQTVVSRLAAAVDARPAQKQAEAAINLNFT